MCQQCSGNLVCHYGACLREVSPQQALCGLDPDLGSLIGSGIVGGGYSVDNAPPETEVLHQL